MTNITKKELIKKAKTLGQFYTKKETAKNVYDLLKKEINNIYNLDEVVFIEPSAWKGVFMEILKEDNKKSIWYDIDPKSENIIKTNFLEDKLSIPKNNVFIWNPPFWKRSKLAIDFFNKASEKTDVIGFILPNQFKKYSVQSKLNMNFKLIKEIDLDEHSFYTEYSDSYNVSCVFQIWVRKNIWNDKDLRILEKPLIKHDNFEMYQYNNTVQALKVFDNDFDFWVLSQWYGDYKTLIYKKEDFNLKKQWTLFKAKDKKTLENLKKLDFDRLSKSNTTVPWFRKGDIVKEYIALYG